MSDSTTLETVNQVLAYGGLGFGAAGVLAPRTLRRLYGMDAESAELTYFGRMWGSRTAAIGAFAMAAQNDEERRQVATIAAAANGADALFAMTNRGLPGRTRVMAGLTSAGFALAALYALGES